MHRLTWTWAGSGLMVLGFLSSGCASEVGLANAAGRTETSPLTAANASCSAAAAIKAGPSPFEVALKAYADEGATTRAVRDLDSACRGTQAHESEANACLLLSVLHLAGEGGLRQRDEAKAASYRALATAVSQEGDRLASMDLGLEPESELFADQGIAIRINSISCRIGRACRAGCETTCEAAIDRLRERIPQTLVRACEAGRGAGCYLAAHAVERGGAIDYVGVVGPTGDRAKADALLDRACTLGVGEACMVAAQREGTSSSVKRPAQIAKACTLGVPIACLEGGDLARRGRDIKSAELSYARACELGLRSACLDLAKMYETGAFAKLHTSADDDDSAAETWPRDEEKGARFRLLGDIAIDRQ